MISSRTARRKQGSALAWSKSRTKGGAFGSIGESADFRFLDGLVDMLIRQRIGTSIGPYPDIDPYRPVYAGSVGHRGNWPMGSSIDRQSDRLVDFPKGGRF